MIERKNKKDYSQAELNAYLASLDTANTDDAWRELGYINASAFKGYGYLSVEASKYNAMIYDTKSRAMHKLINKSENASWWNHVLYVRLSDGIQLSFHFPRTEEFPQAYEKETEWDGVDEAYTYNDIDLYNQAHMEYVAKVEADKAMEKRRSDYIHNSIIKALKRKDTRKKLEISDQLYEMLKADNGLIGRDDPKVYLWRFIYHRYKEERPNEPYELIDREAREDADKVYNAIKKYIWINGREVSVLESIRYKKSRWTKEWAEVNDFILEAE